MGASPLSNQAADDVDLLTVLEHELGHVVGLPDNATSGDLMDITLGLGQRRGPSAADLATIAQALNMPAPAEAMYLAWMGLPAAVAGTPDKGSKDSIPDGLAILTRLLAVAGDSFFAQYNASAEAIEAAIPALRLTNADRGSQGSDNLPTLNGPLTQLT